MQCSETQPLFTEFADNTLGREELHALTNHLLGCQTCAQEWQEFQQLLNVVHSLEAQAPPADLLSGIHAKLAKKGILDQEKATALEWEAKTSGKKEEDLILEKRLVDEKSLFN